MVEKQIKNLFSLSFILVLSSCALKSHKTNPSAPISKTPIIIKEIEISRPTDSVATEKSVEKPADATNNSPTTSQSMTLPKFGFIFSGGGAKAWAHIGVLKELQKLKWPVSAVAGIEWGSVVAAIYAQNLSANEVEWEMSKLKDFDKWDQFIKAAFAKKMTADLKISFVCPSLNIVKQNVYLLNRGQIDQLLPFCLASPSLIKPINQSVAFMMDVPALAQHLRASGISKVILVNVISQDLRRAFVGDFESSDNISWVSAAALLAKKPLGVDDVIEIKLDDFGIKDLNKRREIVAKGSELSYNQLKKLAEKFGL